MGFEGMTWAQISTNLIQTQIIDDLSFKEGVYTLKCADIQRTTRDKIFQLKSTKLAATVDDSALKIYVTSTEGLSLIHI